MKLKKIKLIFNFNAIYQIQKYEQNLITSYLNPCKETQLPNQIYYYAIFFKFYNQNNLNPNHLILLYLAIKNLSHPNKQEFFLYNFL